MCERSGDLFKISKRGERLAKIEKVGAGIQSEGGTRAQYQDSETA